MPLNKAQKKEILDLFKQVDVKKLEIDGVDEAKTKWFRFGSHNGMAIASEIIKAIPEREVRAKTINVS